MYSYTVCTHTQRQTSLLVATSVRTHLDVILLEHAINVTITVIHNLHKIVCLRLRLCISILSLFLAHHLFMWLMYAW